MNEFQEKFIDEARELIQGLESKLLSQELNNGDRATIDEVFRVMHTLKGTSAMFGFDLIEQLTHHLETVYDQIREGEREITTEIIDRTFDAVDFIGVILDNLNKLNENDNSTFNKLLQGIVEISGIQNDNAIRKEKEQVVPETALMGFFIHYTPDEDIYIRGIEPLSIFFDINDLGTYKAIPHLDKTPNPEEFDTNKFFIYWDIFLFAKTSREEVEDVFLFFNDTDFHIYEFDPENLDEKEFLKEYGKITKRQMTEGELSQILESVDENRKVNFSKSEILKQNTETNQKENLLTELEKDKKKIAKTTSLKVSADKLDDLIVNVSEFVTLYSQISLLAQDTSDTRLNKALQNLGKLSKKLRDNALDLRLVPIKDISLKMNRLVRDLSNKLDKNINYVTEGLDTELDKTIIDNLEEPLMHIIRNSIDHGIEDKETRIISNKPAEGIVRLTAFYSGNYVFIQVQDDGKGIDMDVVKQKAIDRGLIAANTEISKKEIYDLIFEPGFSTVQTVSKVSGRGVGMDVVKNKINELRGEIEVDSEVGLGTSITIKLPLTLSIIDTLKIQIENNVYLLPLSAVDNCISVNNVSLMTATKKQYDYKGEFLPVITLRDEFSLLSDIPKMGKMVIIHQYEKKYGLLVDKILGDHQAVVKPLDHLNKKHDFFSGVSVMGDGSLALILDTGKMLTSNKEIYNFK